MFDRRAPILLLATLPFLAHSTFAEPTTAPATRSAYPDQRPRLENEELRRMADSGASTLVMTPRSDGHSEIRIDAGKVFGSGVIS